MLGQGSPPIPNALNSVCMGELSPVIVSSYQKKKKCMNMKRIFIQGKVVGNTFVDFSNPIAAEGLLPIGVPLRWS